jgi:hypothetical protein
MTIDTSPEAVALLAHVMRFGSQAKAADMLEALAAERDGYRKLALAGELTARHVDILTAERDAMSAQVAELEAAAKQRDVRVFELREELDAAEAKLAEREAQVDRLLELQGDQDQKLKDAEAENERLRGVLAVLAGDTQHAGFNPPAPTRTAKIARAALKGDKP